jgi:RHS repeat-associated protein
MNQAASFDQLGRVNQVSQSGGLVSSKRVALGYDNAGRLTQVQRYESGTTSRYVGKTDYAYDAIGRLASIDHVKANGVVAASYDYSYDAANRLTQLQSLIDGATTFAYDTTGQVTNTNAVNPALDESFTYDATGNRVTGTVVGPDNRLVSDASYTYQYDDEGRRTRRTSKANNAYEVYTWDHRGRLTQVQKFTSANQSQGRVSYKYDAFDRKIGRTEYSSTGAVLGREAYVHQGDEVVAILDGSQKMRRAILHGPEVDQVFAEETFTATGAQEEVYWGLADHQGTIRDVSTGYGGLVQVGNHSQYKTFGQSTSSTSPMRYTYTGRDSDTFTGLQYNRARWYDPVTGRFISQDPIGFEAGDANLYRYVGNGPMNATDPSGLMPNQRDAITLDELVRWAELLENKHPNATPHEILKRLRDQIKGPRSSASGGTGSGSEANGFCGSGASGSGSGSTASPQNDNPWGPARWSYIYTTERGWIDTAHFLEAARYSSYLDDWIVIAGGFMVEVSQSTGDRDEPGTYSSSFTPEDLTSNNQGRQFGDGMYNNRKFSQQLREYFEGIGATTPTSAPDWMTLPRNEHEWEKRCWRQYDAEQNSVGKWDAVWDSFWNGDKWLYW